MSLQDVFQGDRRKGRRMLLLLVALFMLPVLLVLAMHYFDWRPEGASHGQLLTPPQPLRLSDLRDLKGEEFLAEQWKQKWSLVYVDASGCAVACQKQAHLLRQVHASLNKEIGRVQRILLVPADVKDEGLAGLQIQYPDLIVLTGNDTATFASQFDLPGYPAGTAGRVYLVDPLGNLMMSYPQSYDPKGLRKDLMRLLTYSWVG